MVEPEKGILIIQTMVAEREHPRIGYPSRAGFVLSIEKGNPLGRPFVVEGLQTPL